MLLGAMTATAPRAAARPPRRAYVSATTARRALTRRPAAGLGTDRMQAGYREPAEVGLLPGSAFLGQGASTVACRPSAAQTVVRARSADATALNALTELVEPAATDDTLPMPPLSGWTFVAKDMIAAAGTHTRFGCAGSVRADESDAALVSHLRELGATLVGKAAMNELAIYSAAPTRNPHNAARTSGGSSCGSAVAVAAGMAHAALGTQTTGSVTRPAAFNGVVGVKATFGLLPLAGVFPVAPSLDTAGFFARTVYEAECLLAALLGASAGSAAADNAAQAVDSNGVVSCGPGARRKVGVFSPTPYDDDRLEPCAAECLRRVLERTGCEVVTVPFPRSFDESLCAALVQYEAVRNLHAIRNGASPLGPVSAKCQARLAAWSSASTGVSFRTYAAARAMQEAARAEFDLAMDAHADVAFVLAPSTRGVAPLLADCLHSDYPAGDPYFSTAVSLVGAPSVHLPLATHLASAMPLGVQAIGRRFGDLSLLRDVQTLFQGF